MRACKTCGTEKANDKFYRHAGNTDGLDNTCKECRKARVRENRRERIEYYQQYDRSRARDPKRVKARLVYQKANPRPRPEPDPVKRNARVLLGNALRDGKLIRPPFCDVCALPCKPHGHHDDYSRPLDVIWCCTSCHALIHKYWRAQKRMVA